MELSPSTLNDIAIRLNDDKKSNKMHFAIMDSNFVPDDPTSWIEGLRMRAVQVGLCENAEQLKFFVTSENETKPNLHWLNNKDVLGLFMKPIDSRQMLFLLSEYLPNDFTMYRFDNLGWSQPQMPVHIAKNVHLDALSNLAPH